MADLSTCFDPHYQLREVTDDPSSYYLRQGEAPGRWMGSGSTRLGLAGEVQPQELVDLFAGKDPRSGVWLIPARGSAARAAARSGDEALDVAAVAARLGRSPEGVRRLLRRGALAGEKTFGGQWRIPAAAVEAHLSGTPQPPAPGPLPIPGPDGCFGIADAARLAGVAPSYLKRIARSAPSRDRTRDNGSPRQYLVATKDAHDHWRVQPAEVRRFIEGRPKVRAVPAYDLVLRAPKSVAVLHALGHLVPDEHLAALGLPGNIAGQVLGAHHAACADAIALLERHAACVRGPEGREPVKGLVVASFDHRSSREGDPLLHTHHVIGNVGETLEGRREALDGTLLFAWARTAGHVYHARLRHELGQRLGTAFETPHHGLADVAGVPRAVIEEFSERSRQIAAQLARLGAHGARAAQVAALDTRAAKDDEHTQTPDQLVARAAALGFGADQLAATLGHQAPAVSPRRVAGVAELLASPGGLTARDSRIGLRDAICGFAGALAEGASLDDLESWAKRLLVDPERFVPVLGNPSRAAGITRRRDGRRVIPARMGERAWSTPELLAHEAALLAAHRAGLGPDGAGVGSGVARPEAVAAATAARPTLRGEQGEMVARITRSGAAIDVVVGGPGTGKTFALGAAAEAWRASGYRVIGAALQGGAAETLSAEAGLDERHTLASLLARCDREGAGVLAGAVVVVDEAGMAGTRMLARLARYAGAAQAKLVLVGDPDQIPEVEAGGAFAALVDTAGPHAVHLEENQRQVDPGDHRRLALVRAGDGQGVLESARAAGRLHVAETADDLRERLLTDWHGDPAEIGTGKLLVAFTHAEVERLNVAARTILHAEARLGDAAVTIRCQAPDRSAEEREIRVGDRVRATRNDWRQGLFTGRVGTVTAVDPDRFEVTLALDEGTEPDGDRQAPRTVTVGRDYLCEVTVTNPWGDVEIRPPGLTHAHASTVNAVQGRTSARAYVLLTEAGVYRQAAYVSLSRARFETHLYAVTVPDPNEVVHHDRRTEPPDPVDISVLARAITRDRAKTLAGAHDPLAADVATLVALPTPWLAAERAAVAEATGPEGIARRQLLDYAWTRQRQIRLGRLETASEGPLPGLLGPAPSHPEGLVPWRRAAAAVLDHRDAVGLYDADLGGPDPWARAIGPCPVDAELGARYDATVALVTEQRTKVTLAELALHAGALPARPHLHAAALAERSLHELRGALDAALERQQERRIAEGIERSARSRLSAALAAMEAMDRPRIDGRVPDGASAAADETVKRHRAALERLSALPEVDVEEVADLRAAMAVRQSRLRHETLTDPPSWVRSHVAGMAAAARHPDVARLAPLYSDLAVEVELAGDGAPEVAMVHQALEPTSDQTWSAWDVALPDPPSPAPELGL